VLNRVLLLPPLQGTQPSIDFQHLAEAFGLDIIMAEDFHWPSTCDDLSSDRLPVLEVSGPRSGPFRDYAGLLRASSYVLVWTCLDHHAQGPLGTFGDPCGGRRPTDNMCQKDGLLGRSGVQSLGESGRVGPCRTSDVRRSWRSWTEATKRGATSHQNPA
ncbi:unnamed protein product, partial [Durusdinium trenchii]